MKLDVKMAILIGTSLSALIVCLDFTIVNIALADIQRELKVQTSLLQWLTNGFGIPFCAFLASMGRLADIIGRKRLLLIGLAGFGIFSLIAGLTSSFMLLIICRLFQGLFASVIFPAGMGIVADTFDDNSRGKAMGIYSSIMGLGILAGPAIGGIVIQLASWRWIFFINIPIVIICISICCHYLRPDQKSEKQSIDWLGIILLALILASLVFGLNHSTINGWLTIGTMLPIIISLVLFILFIFIEKYVAHPILAIKLFNNSGFFIGIIVYIVAVGFTWPVQFLLPLFFQKTQNFSAFWTGIILLPMTIMAAIMPMVIGRIYDRHGGKICIQIIFICLFFAYILMAYFGQAVSLWLVIPAFILFGIAFGTGNGIGATLALSKLSDQQDASTVSGGAVTMLNIGGVLSLSLASTLFYFVQKSHFLTTHNAVSSFIYGFQLVMVLLGIIATVLLIPIIFSFYRQK